MAITFESPRQGRNKSFGHTKFRIDLLVPFSEKDVVKKLGGRWDADLKTWYVIIDATKSVMSFKKWLKSPILE